MLALAATFAEAGLPDGVLNVVPTTSAGEVERRGHGRRPAAQGQLHRVDRGRQDAGRAGRRPAPAGQHGARRQRAVPGLRRRRRRRGGRRRDDRQDAQHGRGLHGRQPVPGARPRSPTSSPRSSPTGWARSASAAARTTASTSGRSSTRRPSTSVTELVDSAVDAGASVVIGGTAPGGPGFFYPPDRAGRRTRTTPRSTARRSSVRSRRSPPSRPRTRRCGWPTTPSTA